jgi:hypothetical protein
MSLKVGVIRLFVAGSPHEIADAQEDDGTAYCDTEIGERILRDLAFETASERTLSSATASLRVGFSNCCCGSIMPDKVFRPF